MPDKRKPLSGDDSDGEPQLSPRPELAPAQWINILRPLWDRIQSDIAATQLSRALAHRHHKDKGGHHKPLLAAHMTRRREQEAQESDPPLCETAFLWSVLGIKPALARSALGIPGKTFISESLRPVGFHAGYVRDLLRFLGTDEGVRAYGVCDRTGTLCPIGARESAPSDHESALIDDRACADFFLKRGYDALADKDSYIVALRDIELLNDYRRSGKKLYGMPAFNPWSRKWLGSRSVEDQARLTSLRDSDLRGLFDTQTEEPDDPLPIEDVFRYLRALDRALARSARVAAALEGAFRPPSGEPPSE